MLTGRFTGHEGVPETVTLTLENGALKAMTGKYSASLVYCGGTRFLAMDAAAPECQRARLEFFIRNGHAWVVRNGSRIFMQEDG